ncbi:SVOPL protein, partial [Amia calva]|nr:SVOPL protein [Amia calva]
ISENKTYSVEQAIEAIGFGRFHVILYVIMGSSIIVEAIEIMLLAVVSPAIRCEWRLKDWQVALVSTMVFFGFVSFSAFMGYLADRYGRWKVVFGCFAWSLYFSFLTSFSPSYGWFVFLRTMVGGGVSGTAQGFVLQAEFIPAKYRGYLTPLSQIFWMCGSFFMVFLGMTVIPTLGWRWMIRLSIIPSIILIILFKFIPESARYNVSAGNVRGAMETLQSIARMNRSSLPEGKLMESVTEKRGNFKSLLEPSFRRTSIILWNLWFIASFSYYGAVLGSSELLERNLLCVTDSAPHTGVLHSDDTPCYCKPFGQSDYHTMLISTLGEVALIPLNMILLNICGRRFCLGFLMMSSGIFFLLLNICTTALGFTALFFILRALVAMVFNTVYLYTAEVYPTTVRAIGMGFCTCFSRVGGMVAPFIAQVL